jgi:hypothetical protein
VLKWFVDIHYLVRFAQQSDKQALFWDEVVESARKLGWATAVHKALTATQAWLDTPVPTAVLAQLAAADEEDLRRLVALQGQLQPSKTSDTVRKLLSMPGRARWRALFGIIFPAPAYMRWRYRPQPAWLWPVYYPYRWGVMAVDALRLIWKRV